MHEKGQLTTSKPRRLPLRQRPAPHPLNIIGLARTCPISKMPHYCGISVRLNSSRNGAEPPTRHTIIPLHRNQWLEDTYLGSYDADTTHEARMRRSSGDCSIQLPMKMPHDVRKTRRPRLYLARPFAIGRFYKICWIVDEQR